MLKARTDLRVSAEDAPLSAAIDAIFRRVRREHGLPVQEPAGVHEMVAEQRAERRKQLKQEGFPFASDSDYANVRGGK